MVLSYMVTVGPLEQCCRRLRHDQRPEP